MPSRRSHVNSHHGCAQCKTRRVKCDETRPVCQKCTKRGIHCSNNDGSTDLCLGRSASPVGGRRSLIRQTQDVPEPWMTFPSPVLQSDFSFDNHSLVTCSSPPLSIVHLLHHYTSHTAATFCDYPLLLPLWQGVVPSLALANPFLLYAIAALSSMHLAHLSPPPKSRGHIQAALHHQDAALALIRPKINDINPQNAEALLVSSLFVPIFDFASPPSDALSQLQTIFSLFRGILAIMDVSFDWVRAGPLALLLVEQYPSNAPPADPDVEAALDRLVTFSCSFSTATSQFSPQPDSHPHHHPRSRPPPVLACTQAIQNLRVAFRNAHLAPNRFSAVFAWAVTVDDAFLDAVRREEEPAMCVLGLYGVLLNGLDRSGCWWTKGWGKALVGAVEEKVRTEEGRELLGWARAMLARKRHGEDRVRAKS